MMSAFSIAFSGTVKELMSQDFAVRLGQFSIDKSFTISNIFPTSVVLLGSRAHEESE